MMLLANKLHQLKVHLKATQANKPRRSNNILGPSHPHKINFLPITRQIPNNAMRTTATTSNNMDCRARKASKMVPALSDHLVDTMALKLRGLLNTHRAQVNKRRLVTQQLVVKEVDTTRPTQLLRRSNKEVTKAHNLNNPATRNTLRVATTLMAIPTTRAHTMLHT
jgi:hypothetical protein